MAVTYTGSRVPRLPPEKLCCSRIVCREKKKTENEDQRLQTVFLIPTGGEK